ncbi:MAG: cbb3-type cytochrome oxidase subunit 3 [Alphaproteobacteria bacterium]
MAEVAEFLRSLWVVWLMAIFIAICFWAYRPRNRRRFEALGRIPLDGEPSASTDKKAE